MIILSKLADYGVIVATHLAASRALGCDVRPDPGAGTRQAVLSR
jgi:hypothetical protein